jgi:endonuclease/exonuclease/phosphatase family metal-dependent hydrolase
MSIKFTCWNIQYGMGVDSRIDLSRQVQSLLESDIYLFNEVDVNMERSNFQDQTLLLGQSLKCEYRYFSPTFSFSGFKGMSHSGNLLLSKKKLLDVRTISLPYYPHKGFEQISQNCIVANIRISDTTCIYVLLTHLTPLHSNYRLVQLQIVCDEISRIHQSRTSKCECLGVVLGGDFNFTETSEEYDLLAGPVNPKVGRLSSQLDLHDVFIGKNVATNNEFGRIDHIFVSESLKGKIEKSAVGLDEGYSDHRYVQVMLAP